MINKSRNYNSRCKPKMILLGNSRSIMRNNSMKGLWWVIRWNNNS